MTVVATLTGALSDRLPVRRLQARMVKVVPQHVLDVAARLELLEGKLSRAVLRGLGGSNPAWLPGIGETCRKVTRPDPTQCSFGNLKNRVKYETIASLPGFGLAPEGPLS